MGSQEQPVPLRPSAVLSRPSPQWQPAANGIVGSSFQWSNVDTQVWTATCERTKEDQFFSGRPHPSPCACLSQFKYGREKDAVCHPEVFLPLPVLASASQLPELRNRLPGQRDGSDSGASDR